MILKVVTVLSLAACVLGEHAISEQKIVRYQHHGKVDHIGHKEPEHHEEYAAAYPSYEFSYKVDDPHTHDKKGQVEHRDGDEVKGEYWLIEPDGRKRTVKYHADKHSGFKAVVEYSAPHHHVKKTDKHEHHKHEEHKHEEHKHGEHKHVEHKHVEHKPVEHKHVEHKPIEHKHVEHRPVERKPIEHKHKEHKPMEHKHEPHKHMEHKIEHGPKIIEFGHKEMKPVHEEHPKHIPALSLHAPRYHKYEEEGYHPRDYRRREYY